MNAIQRTLLSCIALASLMVAPAMADYRFNGTRCGYHAEEQLIDALYELDRAAAADGRYDAARSARRAQRYLRDAIRQVCAPRAAEELRDAVDDLDDFIHHCRIRHLDAAAKRIQRVIRAETQIHGQAHARPVVPIHHGNRHPSLPVAGIGRHGGLGHGGLGHTGRAPRPAGKSFCYTGACCGMPGEALVISALQHMDHAFHAICREDRWAEVKAAREDILAAKHRFRCHEARLNLARALGPLAAFGGSGRVTFLDRAADHLHQALALENKHYHASRVSAPPRNWHRTADGIRNRVRYREEEAYQSGRQIRLGAFTFRY